VSEFDCPSCGRSFDTRRGLGVHHSQVHDERLPNRECSYCGSRFYADYAKEYCSDSCHDDAVSFAGDDNPNYRGARVTSACERCGVTFEYYPSEKEGLYCSECVEAGGWRNPPTPESGPDHPWWTGGKTELECDVCGAAFERYPGNIQGDVVVCSEECRAAWLSEAFSGEGHPNWRGGGNQEYGPGWNEVRQAALERDDHQCVVCGATSEDLGRNPDVHHIVPVRAFAESEETTVEDAHYLDNVVSLCIDCHRKAEFGKIPSDRLRDLASVD
jgi:5-methylcytosine-specific restriction endonuclease McrA